MVRAVSGAALCVAGLAVGLPAPYHSQTFRVDAGGCRLITTIVDPAQGTPRGYVVLLHGLSANARIMSYLTAGLASLNLRVFVPDLPGHGRTSGPFSYDRSEKCSENLVRDLIQHGLLDPEKTILAGHSLGGAEALRAASAIPVAGVIAISPAPMRPLPGVSPEMMPFHEFGALPPHSLVMSAAWEPERIRDAAKELVPIPGDGTSQYVAIPRSTHVSILFDRTAMAVAEEWAAQVLHLETPSSLPSHRGMLGFFASFAGILLLAGPFLRETLQSKPAPEPETAARVSLGRSFVEVGIVGLGAVGLLSYGNPLRALDLFQGGYFASFVLALGVVLLVLHWSSLPKLFPAAGGDSAASRPWYRTILLAAFAAILLFLLITAAIDLTFSEAWLTPARWARLIPFALAVLPYHAAEEILLGPAAPGHALRRLLTSLAFRLVAWGAIVAGIFFLHSGAILLVLLAPYFALFCLLQALAQCVVREVTASPAATAVFGAILLAGFCLVVFPTT